MKSQSRESHFSRAPSLGNIPRSSFDLSHAVKTTIANGDHLTPIFVYNVMPGATLNVRLDAFARLATPLRPIMDNMWMETTWFYVPYRIVWPNFKKMMGEQINPSDSTDYLVPQISASPSTHLQGSIYDQMGLPVFNDATSPSGTLIGPYDHSALPLRAYQMIWDYWFRDQNLQNSLEPNQLDGPDTGSDYGLLKRNKRHDYFTSCLPWPQKGIEVTLPLGETAPVVPTTAATPTFDISNQTNIGLKANGTASVDWETAPNTSAVIAAWNTTGLETDLTSALAVTVNIIRTATAIQRLFELDARGGTRYNEMVFNHFKVRNDDARLQRPEYLGGGSSLINFTAVPQSSEAGTTPQGNMAAYGTASVSGHGFTKSFSEHGVVIGLLNIRADLTYQQGLPRWWSKETRWDFYTPELANLGEQEVYQKELYCTGTSQDEDVFGYQERWAEERYKPSQVSGLFRSDDPLSLDLYHLSQDLSYPALNSAFIEQNTPYSRVVAVPSEPHYLYDSFIKFNAALPMPTYSVPGVGGRF